MLTKKITRINYGTAARIEAVGSKKIIRPANKIKDKKTSAICAENEIYDLLSICVHLLERDNQPLSR